MVKNRINFNGSLVKTSEWTVWHPRGFRYGDGIFETMRLQGGGVPLLPYHALRLKRGLKMLGITDADRYTEERLGALVGELAGSEATGRVRLTVARAEGGKYLPASNESIFVLEFEPVQYSRSWYTEGWHVGVSEGLRMPTHPLANLKSTSALAYVYAARERQHHNWDDILLRNHYGRFSEGGHTNLFCYFEGHWYTPPLGEGGVAGVLRQYLLDHHGHCRKMEIDAADLRYADEIVLTNATGGIHSVSRVAGYRSYPHRRGTALGRWLGEELGG